jgi:vacuolar-type H+-ATPase subunit H
MQQDIQAAVEEMLSIEREADALVDRARAEARVLRADADQKAATLRKQLVDEARGKAAAILAAARDEAQTERESRLEEIDRQIGELEAAARGRMEAAARFAVARLLGEELAAPSADQGGSRRGTG